jgi:thiopeptide-type bacteriocin biosynthesis protein
MTGGRDIERNARAPGVGSGTGNARHTVFEPIGWGLLRAPLLPVVTGDQALARRDVRLALWIASESFAARLENAATPASLSSSRRETRSHERLNRTLWQYLNRMRYRPTPFGLCAGVSLVSWGTATDASIATDSMRPRARLDMGRVCEIITRLEVDEGVRQHLRWVANPAIVHQDGRLYLSEQAAGPLPRAGVSIRATPAALAVLTRASRPVSYQDVVDAVLRRPGATRVLAELLANQLCRESFLLCELWGVICDSDPVRRLIEILERPEVEATAKPTLLELRRLSHDLDKFMAQPSLVSYQTAVASADRARPARSAPHGDRLGTAGEDHALQVDGRWEMSGVRLHRNLATAAAEAAELLLRFGSLPSGPRYLTAWRLAFLKAYGPNTFIPLPVALDRTTGIGPPDRGRRDEPGGHREALARRDDLLYRVALDALREHRTVIQLDDIDVAGLTTWRLADGPAPDNVDIVVAVAAESAAAVDRGDFACVISPIIGAFGAGKVTGRFGDLLGPAGDAALARIGGAEDGLAEVFFRPGYDRLLNVAIRPNPASWLIPVGVPPPPAVNERVLLPKDLLIGVEEGRICLLTGEGRNVTPVAMHVLNLSRAPELARFLLEIPRDRRPALTGFSWGRAGTFPVLPRLQYGRVVLSPARWLCDCSQVNSQKDLDSWRIRWDPPAMCYISEGDNRLLIDLNDPADRKHLLDSFVRRRRWVRLDEALPGPEHAWLPGPDGPRLVELAVPLRARSTASRPSAAAAGRLYRPWSRTDREAITRPPGSDWLFVKVYMPRDAMDSVLVDYLTPLVRQIEDADDPTPWFFIRYSDPGTHLRLRWRQEDGTGGALTAMVLSWAHSLYRAAHASRIVVDTYDREVARYGGAVAMDIAEKIFAADSQFVLGVLGLRAAGTLIGDQQTVADNTELAVLTVDRLLADLGIGREQRSPFCRALSTDRRQSGHAYRERQARLRQLLSGVRSHPGLEDLLATRSVIVRAAASDLRQLEPTLTQPLNAIQASIAHMHLNRLLGPASAYEHLIYGLVDRSARSLVQAPINAR